MKIQDKLKKSSHKWLKISLFMLLGIIGLIIVLLVLGYIIQVQTSKNFATNFSSPGQLVNVNGHQIHIYCTGEIQPGSPTVILDAGNGRSSLDWSLVQPDLAKTARVCSFDRPGYGWSELATTPRTGKNIVDEEKKMLEAAGITGPYILVGHSGGGMYARIFAKYYPQDVAGIVLVDSAAVSADTLPDLQKVMQMQMQQNKVMKWMAKYNILRVLGMVGGDGIIPDYIKKLPQDDQLPYLASMSRSSHFVTMQQEEEQLATQDSEVWQELHSIGSLGDMPLIVLSSQHTFPNSEKKSDEINNYLQQTQKELLKLSSNSKQIIAENSSHDIHIDEPQLVINAVNDLVAGMSF